MHASVEQLLEARDQAHPLPAVGEHLADCARCRDELKRLRGVREALQGLPQLAPAGDPWQAILSRGTRQRAEGAAGDARRAAWPLGLAASLMLAAIVVLLLPRGVEDEAPAIAALDPSPPVPATSELVAQSQQLERMLDRLTYEPRVVNARTAGTIVQLEDQIAWVDYGLTVGRERGLDAREENALWRQRVELMNSLVHVRYAQAQRVDF